MRIFHTQQFTAVVRHKRRVGRLAKGTSQRTYRTHEAAQVKTFQIPERRHCAHHSLNHASVHCNRRDLIQQREKSENIQAIY